MSALVWSKLAFGLSAGRVQTVALRLIVDREREIEAFVPEEYWNFGVGLDDRAPASRSPPSSPRADGEKLAVTNGDARPPPSAPTSRAPRYRVAKVVTQGAEAQPARAVHDHQAPAGRDELPALRHQAHDADRAGALRGHRSQGDGGPVGLITYMRTDSTRVAPTRSTRCAAEIAKVYGKEFVPGAAQRLQVEEERAGRARGHPPDAASSSTPTRSRSTSRTSSSSSTSSSGTASSPRR